MHRRRRVNDSQLFVVFSVSPCLRGFSIAFREPPIYFLRKPHKRVPIVVQRGTRFLSGNKNQIQPRWQIVLRQSERFTYQPLQPIAANGVAVLLRYAEAEPGYSAFVGGGKHQQVSVAGPLPQGVNAIELGRVLQPTLLPQAK